MENENNIENNLSGADNNIIDKQALVADYNADMTNSLMKDTDVKLANIAHDIVTAPNIDVDKTISLFEQASMQKELLRIIKLNNLWDKVEDLIDQKVTTYGPAVSLDTMLDSMKTVEASIDRSNKMIGIIKNTAVSAPVIIENQTNTINLSQESREKVTMAVQRLLHDVSNKTENKSNNETIVSDTVKDEPVTAQNTVSQSSQAETKSMVETPDNKQTIQNQPIQTTAQKENKIVSSGNYVFLD